MGFRRRAYRPGSFDLFDQVVVWYWHIRLGASGTVALEMMKEGFCAIMLNVHGHISLV